MNGEELTLMRNAKKRINEIEDIVMTTVNDKMSQYADEKSNEKYEKVQAIAKKILANVSKIHDCRSLNSVIDDYMGNYDELNKAIDEINDYFKTGSTLSEELVEVAGKYTKAKVQELDALIVFTYFNNYQKVSQNILFQKNKMVGDIIYLLNEIGQETVGTYEKLITKMIDNLVDKLNKKGEEIKTYFGSKNLQVIKHPKLKKILNCKDMDRLLLQHGYKAARQGKTSHLIYSNKKKESIPVPQHKKLDKGLAYGIQREVFYKNII